VPDRNSPIIASRSFCGISPCIEDTVKFDVRIFSVNHSTCAVQRSAMGAAPPKRLSTHLASRIAENDRLSDSEGVVEVAQSVELPLLLLDRNEELLDAFER
jgi:hypothetical protein